MISPSVVGKSSLPSLEEEEEEEEKSLTRRDRGAPGWRRRGPAESLGSSLVGVTMCEVPGAGAVAVGGDGSTSAGATAGSTCKGENKDKSLRLAMSTFAAPSSSGRTTQ